MTTGWHAYQVAATREYERSKDRPAHLFPHYSERGAWELLDVDALSGWRDGDYEHGNWTAGFWFGTMWLAALASGDEGPVELAKSRLPLLADRAVDTTTHDLGFLFFPSVVLGHACGHLAEADTAPAVEAARTTTRRFNDPGRYIQAFGPVADVRTAGTSTIDTLMNLPLLWWAAARTGDSRLFDVARHHARTSARLLVRSDGSTIHLMRMDPLSGAFLEESTLQGASSDSAWSRGSGWAICGLAWSYAVTREPELLDAAERAAAYYERAAVPGELPPWDFASTTSDVPRDASAATAVALGYLILGECHPDGAERQRYDQAGREMLEVISRLAINRDPDVDGILLHSCYSVPHRRGVDGATGWGDFYIGLALAIAEGVLPLDAVLGQATPARSDADSASASPGH